MPHRFRAYLPHPDPAAVLLLVITAVLLCGGPALHAGPGWLYIDALQKMAGYATKSSAFKDAQDYLENLRDGLIPLAIPLGAIGLTGGGVAYMVGNIMAQKILGGVIIGLALTLLGPSLIA
jgi:hypothetical protein